MITVRVVGIPGSERSVLSIGAARRAAIGMSRKHPTRWVDAKDEDGALIHLIEPRSLGGNEPIVAMPADDQGTLF